MAVNPGSFPGNVLRIMAASVVAFMVCSTTAHGTAPPASRKGTPAPATMAIPTFEELQNGIFAGILPTPVKLVKGVYEGKPFVPGGATRPRVELLESQPVTGDLDGDGNAESVVFLSEESGGTATNLYMAVVSRTQGALTNSATVLVGDRVTIQSTSVEKGRIVLELLQFGSKDAACCPSELVTRTWSLARTGLVEQAVRKKPGTLSLATLSGTEWDLRGFGLNESLPGDARVTLHLEKDQLRGTAGCNRYLGSATTTKVPGEITIKASKASNHVCGGKVMAIEERYLDALRNAVRFGFYAGDLTLSWQKDDGSRGILRFLPRNTLPR